MNLDSRTPLPCDTRSNRLLLLALALVSLAVAWTVISSLLEPRPSSSPMKERPSTPQARGRDLALLAVMLGDDASPAPLPTASLERRLTVFSELMQEASQDRLTVRFEIRTLSSRDLGAATLADLSRGFFEWRKRVVALYPSENFNVLVIVPSDPRPEGFCEDNATLGSPLGSRITVCMERYLDISRAQDDEAAAALLIHKILHGYGLNHQVPEHKPLLFLEWALGLPQKNAAGFEGFDDRPPRFFDPYVLRALGLGPPGPYEKDCLISQGLVCVPWRGLCSNLYNIACLDSDQDGIRDSEDPYPFSPPGSGGENDRDRDGIPDRLDLCDGPVLDVSAEGFVGPAKVVFGDFRPNASFRFVNSKMLSARYCCANLMDGFTRFAQGHYRTMEQGEVDLPTDCPIARVELRYRTDRDYLRPFYLYAGQQQWETVYDKEWLYFSRFGCDMPVEVDLANHKTYDANLDGLPDEGLFPFASGITAAYDWDADGVPDREDTLPTVRGRCRNDRVAGVPDSDGDGLCNPSRVELLPYQKGAWPEDLAARLLDDPQADGCPYTSGSQLSGCPPKNVEHDLRQVRPGSDF